ncbi:MAG TPA: hydrogenase formation protein HypD [Thermoanaerobaculia bacterium]|nr:hydrogenase formation protein HypD [Thermoanaerobaculia bacterium]HXK69088.1 hydrogenase formation protein HypD [Thermoanaerobaculia bacterium]
MNTTDLYHDSRVVRSLVDQIHRASRGLPRSITIMEVCGTHTHAIARAGLRHLMPEEIRLISGPGCPVCVTPVSFLDRALVLGRRPSTRLATFGDLYRVPSSSLSLETAHAEGIQVDIVYSPRDCMKLARENPDELIIFLAVGFETTAPTIAALLVEADQSNLSNLMILPGNKIMPPPLRTLSEDPDLQVDGFLLPGHVSVVIGAAAYAFLPDEYEKFSAIVGFTPADILRGVLEIVKQVKDETPCVRNLYERVVSDGGNRNALALMDRVFHPCDAEWRGLGVIPGSGLTLREPFAHRNAERIDVDMSPAREPAGCRCGDILKGTLDPPGCPLFGKECHPDSPVGACMVSSEGSCSAWYRHEKRSL